MLFGVWDTHIGGGRSQWGRNGTSGGDVAQRWEVGGKVFFLVFVWGSAGIRRGGSRRVSGKGICERVELEGGNGSFRLTV